MAQRAKLVAANWKMNGRRSDNDLWLRAFRAAPPRCETVVCPPFVYLDQVAAGLAGTPAALGAQDVSDRPLGAWTGEVAAEMLLDCGASWVVLGHSERRASFGHSDAIVAAKVERAIGAGLRPILCVGETLHQREQGLTMAVVAAQLDAVLQRCPAARLGTGAIAYEPVWAIGTGRTASPAEAQEVHAAIRARIAAHDPQAAAQMRLLYGGSVKPGNAAELFAQADIDGGLIGGASLVAADFLAICAGAAH
jgi:triosephosphate isomerase